jgi:formylglycine-generating enzyme required for sulfatase activity
VRHDAGARARQRRAALDDGRIVRSAVVVLMTPRSIVRVAVPLLCAMGCDVPPLPVFPDVQDVPNVQDAQGDADVSVAPDAQDAQDAGDASTCVVANMVQTSCATSGTPGCGMQVVAGGTFTLGDSSLGDPINLAGPAQPGMSVGCIAMDTYEVTVARFRAYWNAGHPDVPSGGVLYPNGRHRLSMHAPNAPGTGTNCNWSATTGTLEDHPINCLNWSTAQGFCAWDGGRLPTEAEWEWVARWSPEAGTMPPRTYAWGENTPTCSLANFGGCSCATGGARTCAVGSYPATYGFYDLMGNVFEFVADDILPYSVMDCWSIGPQQNPLCIYVGANNGYRGGGFNATELYLHTATRGGRAGVDYTDTFVGFRCARSP